MDVILGQRESAWLHGDATRSTRTESKWQIQLNQLVLCIGNSLIKALSEWSDNTCFYYLAVLREL